MRKKFSFILPSPIAAQDKMLVEGMHAAHTASWRINGEASVTKLYSRNCNDFFEFVIHEIFYDGTDINPVLATSAIVDKVKEACNRHIHHLFTQEQEVLIPVQPAEDNRLAKILYLPFVLQLRVK